MTSTSLFDNSRPRWPVIQLSTSPNSDQYFVHFASVSQFVGTNVIQAQLLHSKAKKTVMCARVVGSLISDYYPLPAFWPAHTHSDLNQLSYYVGLLAFDRTTARLDPKCSVWCRCFCDVPGRTDCFYWNILVVIVLERTNTRPGKIGINLTDWTKILSPNNTITSKTGITVLFPISFRSDKTTTKDMNSLNARCSTQTHACFASLTDYR